jgi:hypothetical protein
VKRCFGTHAKPEVVLVLAAVALVLVAVLVELVGVGVLLLLAVVVVVLLVAVPALLGRPQHASQRDRHLSRSTRAAKQPVVRSRRSGPPRRTRMRDHQHDQPGQHGQHGQVHQSDRR